MVPAWGFQNAQTPFSFVVLRSLRAAWHAYSIRQPVHDVIVTQRTLVHLSEGRVYRTALCSDKACS
jgi:hypothetical protein